VQLDKKHNSHLHESVVPSRNPLRVQLDKKEYVSESGFEFSTVSQSAARAIR